MTGLVTLLLFLVIGVLIVLAANKLQDDARERQRKAVEEEQNTLLKHAHYELNLLRKDPKKIQWYLDVLRTYSSFGLSGDSNANTVEKLYLLLKFENLLPLTDNPVEWELHNDEVTAEAGPIWMSRRNNKAFSKDAGKSYYLITEFNDAVGDYPLHVSDKHEK